MSVIAAALKHMLSGGMTQEAILAAIAEIEAEMIAKVANDPVADKRRAYDRGRKAERRAADKASKDVSTGLPPDSADKTDGVSLNKEGFQTFQEIKSIPVDAKRARATRIREGWVPSRPLPATVVLLVAQWPPGRIDRELEGFQAYWTARSRDAARTDWDLVWHNRIRDQHDKILRESRNVERFRDPRNGRTPATGASILERLRADDAAAGIG